MTDWNKRKELVNEYLSTRDELKDRFISQRIGEEYRSEETRKLFKPLLEQGEETKEEIKKQSETLTKLADTNQLMNFTPLQPLAINASQKEHEWGKETYNYIINKLDNPGYDHTFGIKVHKDRQLSLGRYFIHFKDNYLIVDDDNKYYMTPGFRSLLLETNPDMRNVTKEDKKNYKDITRLTKNLIDLQGNLKQASSTKYKEILRPMIERDYPYKIKKRKAESETETEFEDEPTTRGKGGFTGYPLPVILPCNPNDLIERMNLLFASREAGNTGVDNELKAIFKELHKKTIINKRDLKTFYDKLK